MTTLVDRPKVAPSGTLIRTAVAIVCGVIGLGSVAVGGMYIAGLFGLSISFASQIIAAISVGGWVLAVVMAAISGGIASVVVATARWAITRWGKTVAAA